MISSGVKTEEMDRLVTQQFVEEHVMIGIKSLSSLIEEGVNVRHLRFD